MAGLKEIINALPRTLRLRFDSIGGYVQAILNEEQESLPRHMRLAPSEVDTIKLVAFAYAARRLFLEGTAAAQHAVDELRRFELPGFQVGNTLFSGRNENVMLGEMLAQELTRCFVRTRYYQIIISSEKLTDLIRKAINQVRHERNLG